MKDNIRSYHFIAERLAAAREEGNIELIRVCNLCLSAWWRPHDKMAYYRANFAIDAYRNKHGETYVTRGRYMP